MDPQNSLQFESTGAMIDCLTALPTFDISNIRRIRLKAFPFPVYTDENMESYHTYFMGTTLSFFLGLALDLLTAEDPFAGSPFRHQGSYYNVETLIESKGWKELHYFAPTNEFMLETNPSDGRVAQPAGWDKLLKEKDGEDSGAEVRMFMAKEPGLSAGNAQTSMAYEGSALERAGLDREVLVVAKRGRDAAYVQDGSDLDEELKGLWSSMSWLEIKEERYVAPEDFPCGHL